MSSVWSQDGDYWWAEDGLELSHSLTIEPVPSLDQDLNCPPWPALHEAEDDPGQELLDLGLADEMQPMNVDHLSKNPSLFLEVEGTRMDLPFPESHDGYEVSSYRSAFKESFIVASHCHCPAAESGLYQSESSPSSGSMIAIHPPSQYSGGWPIQKQMHDAEDTKDGLVVGMAGCESSNNLRQMHPKVKLEPGLTSSIDESEDSDAEGVSDAESDTSEPGHRRIDLWCKGETLGSDSDELSPEPVAEITWSLPFKSGGMEFIPVSNAQFSSRSSASAATSVGSPKRGLSPISSSEELTKMKTAEPEEPGVTLTEKLLLSLQHNAGGPVANKNVKMAQAKAVPAPKARVSGRTKKAPAKQSGKGKKAASGRQDLGLTRKGGMGSKTRTQASFKEAMPARRRAGRPKKMTAAGAEFKSAQNVKRRRAASGKTARASAGQSCMRCFTHVTPVWRPGPDGPKTLCNACWARYMKVAKRK